MLLLVDAVAMTTKRKPRNHAIQRRTIPEMVENYVAQEVELQKALHLFHISMKQYARSLAYLSRPQVSSHRDTASAFEQERPSSLVAIGVRHLPGDKSGRCG